MASLFYALPCCVNNELTREVALRYSSASAESLSHCEGREIGLLMPNVANINNLDGRYTGRRDFIRLI